MAEITGKESEKLLQEAILKATTSGGKGGQNVNKVATRVELYFEVDKSMVLDDDQKQLVLAKLQHRISGAGVLRVTSSEGRTQLENRERAKEKFIQLINKALVSKKQRKQTAPTQNAISERLRRKKLQGEKKLRRSLPDERTDY